MTSVALCTLTLSQTAMAESDLPKLTAFGHVSASGGWVDSTPSVYGLKGSVPSTLQSMSFRESRGMQLAGVGGAFGFRGDYVMLTVLGVHAEFPLNAKNVDQDLVDTQGNHARLRLTDLGNIQIEGAGLGIGHLFRGPDLWMSASIIPRVIVYRFDGTLETSFTRTNVSADNVALGLNADFEVCSGVHGNETGTYLCAFAEPMLWRTVSNQDQAFNGMLIGARVLSL
jgi:hypothetical protein